MEPHPTLKILQRPGPDAPWELVLTTRAKGNHLCQVILCRHKPRGGRKFCHRCQKMVWRVNNPVRALFNNVRDNARKRKKDFTLTWEEFEPFAIESGYYGQSGRFLGCLHIDRKDPLHGYHIWNIRVLEAGENSAKGTEDKKAIWLDAKLKRGQETHQQPELIRDPDYVGF